MIFTITLWERKEMRESFTRDKDDLQMSYVFVTIFIKILLCFHSVGVFQSVLKYIHPCWGDYILVSCISFSTQDPYALSMLRAFHLPNEGSPWQTQSNGVKRRESIFKKFKTKWEDTFFWSSFPVCWHELKAHCPRKKMESSLIRKKKKSKRSASGFWPI